MPVRMAELLSWLNNARILRRLHPLVILTIFVLAFLEIHPFQDGNGRLRRVLTTLLLLQAGYAYVPHTSLESVIEHNNEGYCLELYQTQNTFRTDTPDWQPWMRFFMRVLQQQKRQLATKVEREKITLTALNALSLNIMDHVRDRGRVTTREMVQIIGASRDTLKATFGSLVAEGLLVRNGGDRSTWYSLP